MFLDIAGRVLTFFELRDKTPVFIRFFSENKDIAWHIAPYVIVILTTLFLATLEWPQLAFWRKRQSPTGVNLEPIEKQEKMPITIHDCFDKDFPQFLRIFNELQVGATDTGETVKVECALYLDPTTNTDFISLYVPHSSRPYVICGHLGTEIRNLREQLKSKVGINTLNPGDTKSTASKDLIFSGRVYIYHEDELTLQEQAALDNIYKQHNLSAVFRGHSYATTKWLQRIASDTHA